MALNFISWLKRRILPTPTQLSTPTPNSNPSQELSATLERDQVTTFKFRVEPLFSCLIGGVVLVNVNNGARTEEWNPSPSP